MESGAREVPEGGEIFDCVSAQLGRRTVASASGAKTGGEYTQEQPRRQIPAPFRGTWYLQSPDAMLKQTLSLEGNRRWLREAISRPILASLPPVIGPKLWGAAGPPRAPACEPKPGSRGRQPSQEKLLLEARSPQTLRGRFPWALRPGGSRPPRGSNGFGVLLVEAPRTPRTIKLIRIHLWGRPADR